MLPQILAIPAAIFLVIFTFIIFLKPQHNNWNSTKRLPPGPKPLPIIGNLHILGKLPHRTLQALATKYGPIMSLKLGQVPAVVVSSPEFAELFLKTHDMVFASRPKLQLLEITFGRKGLAFTEYGGYWRNVRKLCTMQLLSASKIDMFGPLRKKELGLLVNTVKKASDSREVVDLSELISEVVENITYNMILGRSKDDRFDIKGVIHEIMNLLGTFNVGDYVPILASFDIQGLKRRAMKAFKAVDEALDQIINDHEHPSSVESPQCNKDFIDILLSYMNQPMDPHDHEQRHIVGRANIKAIVLDMIAGAFDTSRTAIEWGMSELMKNPRTMKKLQNEIEALVGINRQVEEKDLNKLPYLDMVVKEILRLYPVAPLLVPHESLEDVTINGYFIEKNTRIMVNAWAIGRDPRVWSENCNVFFPERFEDNDVDVKGHDFRLIPFGSGRRGCPGMNMGLTTTKIILAQLVHCFSWELPLDMSPKDLDMTEDPGLTIPRSKHLLARPTYRLLSDEA